MHLVGIGNKLILLSYFQLYSLIPAQPLVPYLSGLIRRGVTDIGHDYFFGQYQLGFFLPTLVKTIFLLVSARIFSVDVS